MPDFVYSDDRLTKTALKVYSFIHTFRGDYFYFGNDHLAKMFNCSESAITEAISLLTKLEYIAIEFDIKAGGGKLRFVKDLKFEFINGWTPVSQMAESDSAKSLSRNEADHSAKRLSRNEAKIASRNVLSNNDIKIKEDFFEKTSKEQRPLKRSSGFGNYPAKSQYPEKKKRVYVDGRGIV